MLKKLQITVLLLLPFISSSQFWKYTDPVKLLGSVNSEAEESIPVFAADSKRLYFVRTFDRANRGDENDQDIWFAEKGEDGTFTKVDRVAVLNNKFNNAVAGISQDGTRMYVLNTYEGKKDQAKGIAVTELVNGKWQSPEKVNVPGLDIDGDFYGFFVSLDEQVMIISYNGPGSLGEEDLYVSTKQTSGWTSPKHMGAVINSSGYEISPFLTRGGDTLFFSSNGMGGQGDADIFYSVKKGAWDQWSEPVNLGSSINSPKFDAYFSHSGSQAFWSSNKEDERAEIYTMDILTPPPLEIECKAKDVTAYGGADGLVDVSVTSGADPYTYNWSNSFKGKLNTGLRKGEYTVTVTDAVGQQQTATCFVDEPAKPIDPVVVKDYENFEFIHVFKYNKNKVTVRKGKLRKFVKQVEEQIADGREQITVSIHSSASKVPTKTFGTNDALAQKRAENIKYDLVDYFTSKGLESKVTVVISKVEVAGPDYEDDAGNRSKYEPFQFVKLRTE